MTDRVIAVTVETKTDVTDLHLDALSMFTYISSATKLTNSRAFLILDREIRTDDFEPISAALELFGFTVTEGLINTGSLSMDRRVAKITAEGDLVKYYAAKKPTITDSGDLERFVVDMGAWSHVMDKLYTIWEEK